LRAKLQLVPQLDRERDALVNRHWYAVRRQVMGAADSAGDSAAVDLADPTEEISQ
jgi:quinolinate synthase